MDDLISRQAAIDAVGNMLRRKFGIGGDLANITLAGLPSTQRKVLKYTGESICLHCQTVNCDGCVYEPMEGV